MSYDPFNKLIAHFYSNSLGTHNSIIHVQSTRGVRQDLENFMESNLWRTNLGKRYKNEMEDRFC